MDEASQEPAGPDVAERGLARLRELSPDIRAAAVLSRDGKVIAADPAGAWEGPVGSLWAAADAAGAGAIHLHVGTEDGELFAVRDETRAVVAVSRRFALASLMVSDLRALLRDLGKGSTGTEPDQEAAG